MRNPSSRDPNQIVQYSHDEKNNAQRVMVVGGDFGLADAIKEGLKDLKFQQPEFPKFFQDEKEVIVKQYEVLEVPRIIKEQEIKIIEVPKVIFETKLIEIDKPFIVKETEVKVIEQQIIVREVKDIDNVLKKLMIIQAITLVLFIIKLFI